METHAGEPLQGSSNAPHGRPYTRHADKPKCPPGEVTSGRGDQCFDVVLPSLHVVGHFLLHTLSPKPYMNDLPPRPQRLIRKSAYGRTTLFLPSESNILREVKSMGGITRYDTANVYHLLPEAYKRLSTDKPVCCWHCCEPITNTKCIVPLPRMYDATERLYHVYGATCSPGCAKGYILEHTTFDRGQHLNVLTKMLREVYGVSDPITETPPRPALQKFGGVFDPAQTCRPAECRLVEPPFVSYCMLVEEKNRSAVLSELPRPPPEAGSSSMEVEEADTFDEPQPPAMFDGFLSQRATHGRDAGGSSSVAPRPITTRKRPPPAPAVGPMAKFVKS